MTAHAPPAPLLTAEEYGRIVGDDTPTELVRGRIIEMTPPYPYHGFVCTRLIRALDGFVEAHKLGCVLANDSGVITERDPDTVRGADVGYYSFARLPQGPFPQGQYLRSVPDLVGDVVSPSDRQREVLAKVAEYLAAGVTVVVVVEPRAREVVVYRDDRPAVRFGPGDMFEFPDVLPGFAAPVRGLFE